MIIENNTPLDVSGVSIDYTTFIDYPPFGNPTYPGNPLYPMWPYPGWTEPANTTYTINVSGYESVFLIKGDEFILTLDVPGFGKPEDTLEVYIENDRLAVYRNSMKFTYAIPEKLNRDTLSAKVEFGQIIITADVKEQYERKSIPVEFRR